MTLTHPAHSEADHARPSRRVTWLAGSRGELLLLGSAFQALSRRPNEGLHCWLLHTGEQGMAAYQALDLLGLIPDESAPLCHPADEPAVRLNVMIERAEGFIRQRKGNHVVFSGFGPTAAATAIYCHARGCRGLWLRPPDPAGLVARSRWEAGLERIIRACAPCVEIRQIPAVPDWLTELSPPQAADEILLEEHVAGLRPGAPLVLITVLRRDWGTLDDTTSRLARAAADWATARPDADWLILSNLNARLEAPVRSLKERPDNLLLAPPLPYPVYRRLLERARLMLTDSPLCAAEALQRGLPIGSLGDLPPGEEFPFSPLNLPLLPDDLDSEAWREHINDVLESPVPAPAPALAPESEAPAHVLGWIQAEVERWLGEA